MSERRPDPTIIIDVASLDAPDLATIEFLARLRLAAARSGRALRLDHVTVALLDLLELTGLAEVFVIGECEHQRPRPEDQAASGRTAGRSNTGKSSGSRNA